MTRRANEFTANTKARAHLRDDGRCTVCTRKVGIGGERAEYDHIVPVWEGGDNSLGNCRTLCAECHRSVTTGQAAERSEARRHQKKAAGIKRPGRRGFRQWRKFNGDIVRKDSP